MDGPNVSPSSAIEQRLALVAAALDKAVALLNETMHEIKCGTEHGGDDDSIRRRRGPGQ